MHGTDAAAIGPHSSALAAPEDSVNRRRLIPILGVPIALLLLSAQPLVAAPNGNAEPAAKVRFGAKLTTNLQPSNAGPAHICDVSDAPEPCTWVMNKAQDRLNGEKAPMNGVIRKIRLIAAVPGQFQLQFVKFHSGHGKAVKNGPVINYQGQPDTATAGGYVIEVFPVNITIKQGWRLAAKASSLSTLRCNSGGPAVYQFVPPLVVGAGFRDPDSDDGCMLLLEAQYQ
jgi:hypothetical protein